MYSDYIDAFSAGIRITLRELLDVTAVHGSPHVVEGDQEERNDLFVSVGVAAPFRGCVVLGFPIATALAITGRIMGRNYGSVCSPVVSAVLALADQVCQEARAEAMRAGLPPLALALPQASQGAQHGIATRVDTLRTEIPFTSELGRLVLVATVEGMAEFAGTEGMGMDAHRTLAVG